MRPTGMLADRPDIVELAAEVLKALGHPVRLHLVALLAHGEHTVTGLAEKLGQPQPIVSQQLRILRMRGLVAAKRRDGFAWYRLAEPGLHNLLHCIEACSFCRWSDGAPPRATTEE